MRTVPARRGESPVLSPGEVRPFVGVWHLHEDDGSPIALIADRVEPEPGQRRGDGVVRRGQESLLLAGAPLDSLDACGTVIAVVGHAEDDPTATAVGHGSHVLGELISPLRVPRRVDLLLPIKIRLLADALLDRLLDERPVEVRGLETEGSVDGREHDDPYRLAGRESNDA